MSAEGYQMDPMNTKPVKSLTESTLKAVGELRKLFGFLGYFRHYIKDFARLAKPLPNYFKRMESKRHLRRTVNYHHGHAMNGPMNSKRHLKK